VNRRVVLAGALVVGLLGAAFAFAHGLDPVLAGRFGVDRAPVAAAAAPQPSELMPLAAPESAPTPEPLANPSTPVPQASSLTDVDPKETFGSKGAPIVMEVFSDFQCPACKTLFLTTNRQLMDNYVSTGKVYLIHRDFPLPMHAHSRVAAQYSRAAAQLGKLEQVEDVLFQNQEKWEQTGDVDGTVATVLSATEMNKVRALVKGGALDAAISKDVTLGQGYRVNQTPTTIIHSKGQTYPVVGVVSYDVLHSFLDQLLNQH
jgi:protein-disulfide isomerase